MVATLALWGCDPGPSGPGTLTGSVLADGTGPGAALLVLTGEGLVGAEGAAGTLGWSSPTSEGADQIRLLLVDPDPVGAMTFEVEVRDVSAPVPSITVLQLADRENRRFTTEDIQIRIRR